MSSDESDDDFQSADEGTDNDETQIPIFKENLISKTQENSDHSYEAKINSVPDILSDFESSLVSKNSTNEHTVVEKYLELSKSSNISSDIEISNLQEDLKHFSKFDNTDRSIGDSLVNSSEASKVVVEKKKNEKTKKMNKKENTPPESENELFTMSTKLSTSTSNYFNNPDVKDKIEVDQENVEVDQENVEVDQENIEVDQEKVEVDQENVEVDQENVEIDQENVEVDQEKVEVDQEKVEIDQEKVEKLEIDIENDKVESDEKKIEVNQEIKEVCKQLNNPITSIKEIKTEDSNTDRNATKINPIDKPKRIRESKIGLKKPRERLGERLGNKKLGSRITKPLVGISSDSLESSYTSNVTTQPNTYSNNRENTNDLAFNKDDDVSAGWGSWGDWGSTLASAALTLSKGVGTVLETVESGMGIPDAETLAHETVETEKKTKELCLQKTSVQESINEMEVLNRDNDIANNPETSFGFGFGGLSSLVSGVSDAFETASNKVLLGGLDTLEKIGRKTMDVIQDGDPGLKRKRAFLKSRSNNLSSVLKEARQRAINEEEVKNETIMDGSRQSFRQISMIQIWDSTDGSAHSEALALVSNRCKSKTSTVMQDLPALGINRLFPLMNKIKACSELPEDNEVLDVTKELTKLTRDIDLPLQFTKIIKGWPTLEESLCRLSIQIQGFGSDECQLNDVQRDLLEEVAQLVAHTVGIIHKAAELSLVTRDLECVVMAKQFQLICGCLSSGLEQLADNICESITRSLPSSETFVSSCITNIYLQMAEANSFLQISLQHFTVVLIQIQAKQIASELL